MRVATVKLMIAFFGVLVLGVFTHSSALDVDAQIERIQSATPKERVELMNELKRHLAQMNQAERQVAITKLQEKMHSRTELLQHKKASQNKSAKMMQHQMRANEQIHQMQHMNQMQGGNQLNYFQHQGGGIGGGGMPGAQAGSNGGMRGGGGGMFGVPHR